MSMDDGHQKQQRTEVAADALDDIHDDRSTGNWVMETVVSAVAGARCCDVKRQYSSGDVALDAGCPSSAAASNSRGSPFSRT